MRPEDAHITTFEEILAALNVYLKPELLTSIRKYIANRRHAVYEITDNIHEVIIMTINLLRISLKFISYAL